ncbi:MAG TPA: SDR family oxidoreductase [Kofleriaceae bacterium]|nr:SDR family oxidoreductase [Kofleriaceae bacterium]
MSAPILEGKVALVTGGTTGIGLATALAFRDAGAKVVVTGANPDNLAKARDALGPTAVAIRADARSVDDAVRLADELKARFGGVDVVFLNAGVARFAPLDAIDERFYDDIMDINVKGVVFTLRQVLPLLRDGASVLVNTSVVAEKGVANASIYSASKGALAALVRSLAVELAGRGVRVNAIAPGPIATPIYGKTGLPAAAVEALQADMASRVPQRRFGAADEVARTALFLASPAASYVTGAEIPVDGGLGAA